jgi:hypothetical protein
MCTRYPCADADANTRPKFHAHSTTNICPEEPSYAKPNENTVAHPHTITNRRPDRVPNHLPPHTRPYARPHARPHTRPHTRSHKYSDPDTDARAECASYSASHALANKSSD